MWQGASVVLARRIIRLGIGLALGAVLCALLQPADATRRPHDTGDASIAVRTSASPPPASPREVAKAAYKHLTPRQRVGQLFMMGVLSTALSRSDVQALRNGRGGNVFLFGNNSDGRADVRRVVTLLRHATSHHGVRPFVGVDQEGGLVQHLKGPGFSRMPSAVDQGRLSPTELRNSAHRWGRQLRAAGLNLDLAPVADTVPASVGTRNKPIGRLHREYGHSPRRVRIHVAAFVRGMGRAGVETAVKHFPGLGRATGNTDDRRRVTDPTRPGGPYLTPYRAGADAGAQFVMVSSAIYPHIDPGVRACFSIADHPRPAAQAAGIRRDRRLRQPQREVCQLAAGRHPGDPVPRSRRDDGPRRRRRPAAVDGSRRPSEDASRPRVCRADPPRRDAGASRKGTRRSDRLTALTGETERVGRASNALHSASLSTLPCRQRTVEAGIQSR